MHRPTILLTNDDGIDAPGIAHLFDALKDFANLYIVAPKTNQSCKSLSLTLPTSIQAHAHTWPKSVHAYKVDGTPADCVKFALHHLLNKKPDLICSGINNGHNAGASLLYSGTVAACIQGTIYETPSIAFSAPFSSQEEHLVDAKKTVLPIVKHFLEHKIPAGSFINVNTPFKSEKGIQGIRFSKQGKSYWETTIKKHEEDPLEHFRISDAVNSFREESHSDIFHIENNYVTVSPIHVANLTHHTHFEEHKETFESALSHLY
jgi:5'-nucleotidase